MRAALAYGAVDVAAASGVAAGLSASTGVSAGGTSGIASVAALAR